MVFKRSDENSIPLERHQTVIVQRRDQTEGVHIYDSFTFRTSANYEKVFKKSLVMRRESPHYGKPYVHQTFIHEFLKALSKATGSTERFVTVVDMIIGPPEKKRLTSILRYALNSNVTGILFLVPGSHEIPYGKVYDVSSQS
jgi:hypothetical protein